MPGYMVQSALTILENLYTMLGNAEQLPQQVCIVLYLLYDAYISVTLPCFTVLEIRQLVYGRLLMGPVGRVHRMVL